MWFIMALTAEVRKEMGFCKGKLRRKLKVGRKAREGWSAYCICISFNARSLTDKTGELRM